MAMTPSNPQLRTRRNGKKFRDVEKYENPSYPKLIRDERKAKAQARNKKIEKVLTNMK